MLRVGMIGCGGIAGAHVSGWQAVKAAGQAEIVALCDVSEANLDTFESKLGASGLARYHDWTEMLAGEGLDAVDICLPHHLHAPAILAATAAKAAILCEKPLCMDLDEAAQIKTAVESTGTTLMCAHNQLFFPAIRKLRDEIDKGTIGTPQMVYSADCFRTYRTREEWAWRADLETAGGGVLIDTGYHPTYRLLHMAGSAAKAVTAITASYHAPIDGEDVANVLVKFASGAVGQILTSWAFPMAPGAWQVMVYGSEGALFGRGNQYRHQPYHGDSEELTLEQADGFCEEVKHFIGCLLTNTTPIQTHIDGINVLELILSAYRSEREGITVSL